MIDASNWKEFRIGDLFDISTGSLLKIKEVPFGDIPRISVKSDNNGILGYYDTENIPEARHVENFISVNFFGNAFYHPYKASLEMKVHCLKLKNKEFTERLGLYFVSVLNKVFSQQNYSYGEQLSSSDLKNKELYIKIPVTPSGEPDWDFMEQYIAELEEERVAELEKYLIATGLDDYELTNEDKAVLCISDEKNIEKYVGDVIWKKIKIGDIFDSQNGDFDIKKEHINGKGLPVVSSGVADRGLIGKTDIKAKEFKARTLTVDMFGNAFYRDEPYKMVTHARVFSLTPKIDVDDKIGEYLETKLKSLNTMFEYNNMCSFKKIQDLEIELPFDKNGSLHTIYIYIYIYELSRKLSSKKLLSGRKKS